VPSGSGSGHARDRPPVLLSESLPDRASESKEETMDNRETCPICDGEGKLESVREAGDEVICTTCHGSGEVEVREYELVPWPAAAEVA